MLNIYFHIYLYHINTIQQKCVVICYNNSGDVMKTIGEKLKQIRETKGFPQKHVADLLGIQRPNYSKVENNKQSLTPSQIKLFCEFFDVSADYILDIIVNNKKTISNDQEETIKLYANKIKDALD